MYRIDIGIDLGSSNICIYMRDKGIVINQPSALAYEKKSRKILAVGSKAKKMTGKTTDKIVISYPIRHGVISEYSLAERMLKAFVKNALKKRRIWGRPNVCVTVPVGLSEVERRAVENAVIKTGAKEVFLLETPVAAALGSGVDIMETKGHMIVNIGGGTTNVAIITAGDVSCGKSIRVGGDDLTEALSRYVRKKYNLVMGELSAEDAKAEIGSVWKRKIDSSYEIKGKNVMNGLPAKLELSSNETIEAFTDITNQMIDAIKECIEDAGPELVADIQEEGILLSGGGARIHGMERLIQKATGIKTVLSDEPEIVVSAGAGMAGEYIMVQDEDTKQ